MSSTMTDTEHRDFIRNFSFDKCKQGSQGFQRLLLQLFGFVGHGRSSFINTCISVWRNSSYVNHAGASGSHKSHTTQRFTYPLTENLTLVDNRGYSTMNSYETGEIFAQLANLLPLDKPVGWSKGCDLADRIVEAEVHVQSSDFIVPILVYSVEKAMASGELEELKDSLITCKNLIGVVPIVVLTNKNNERLINIQKMFSNIGIERFFSLENYTEENPQYSRDTHESVIKFLFEVLQDAMFSVDHTRDPEKEMQERKISVLNYIHDREMRTHRNGLERQNTKEISEMEEEMKLKASEAEQQQQKERQLHEEKKKNMEDTFNREMLRVQFEHEQRMKVLTKKTKKKKK